MKLLAISLTLFSLSLNSILAGGVSSPRPTVKKTIELRSMTFEVSPDFTLDGQNGAQNIEVNAINRHLSDDIEKYRDRLVQAFHSRHTGSASTPVFSFIALDHPFFSMVSIFLQDFDYKRVSNKVMNHLFTLNLPLQVNLEFFDRNLKGSLANIFIPRNDSVLLANIFKRVISQKGKVQIIMKNELVFSTSSRTKCLVSLKSHFSLVDLDGKVIEGEGRRQGAFATVNKTHSEFVRKECSNLGLID